jgi:hypothetical protein
MPGWGIAGVTILPDGTTTVNRALATRDLALMPDGRVLTRPYFSTAPDSNGWVAATDDEDSRVVGTPIFLNVASGETRRLTYLTAGDTWAPIVDSARRLYLADMGGAVLVDESIDGIHVEPLPGWARTDLEIETRDLPDGGVGAYVALWKGVHHRVPLWLYDVRTRTLAPALPDGVVPDDATGSEVVGGVSVISGGARVWALDVATGVLIDYRAGLAVRPLRPLAGGAADWMLLANNQLRLYRYDRRNGTLEDLGVSGTASVLGQRALVAQGGRPSAVIHLDEGRVSAVSGGSALPASGAIALSGGWAEGLVLNGGTSPDALTPAWRIDLETSEARLYPGVGLTLQPLGAGGTSPAGALGDGRAGMFLYDGFAISLNVAGPDLPWGPIGRAVRDVAAISWFAGSGFAIAAERECSTYLCVRLAWDPASPGGPDVLSGTSLQLLARDGTDLFPPSTEHLGGFSDGSSDCALAHSDAGDYAVYDLAAGTRLALGRFDALTWVANAPGSSQP